MHHKLNPIAELPHKTLNANRWFTFPALSFMLQKTKTRKATDKQIRCGLSLRK